MVFALILLGTAIVLWLISAFTLEMLGWRSHRQVWMASVFFFGANVNLLSAMLDGYKQKKKSVPGQGWAKIKVN
jgi:phosphatidylinositol glycan class M